MKFVRLNLSENMIPDIEMFQNNNITEFSANCNKITKVPENISANMRNLIILSLCENHLQTIPYKIWTLEKLDKLLLNNCGLINFLYPEIKFVSLKVLELEGNKL